MGLSTKSVPVPIEHADHAGRGRSRCDVRRELFRSLIVPAFVFGVIEALDGLLTTWAVNNGFSEINPLSAGYAGSWLFPITKVLAVVAAAALLWPAVKKHPRLVKYGFVAVSVFVGFVVLTNLYEIAVSVT